MDHSEAEVTGQKPPSVTKTIKTDSLSVLIKQNISLLTICFFTAKLLSSLVECVTVELRYRKQE